MLNCMCIYRDELDQDMIITHKQHTVAHHCYGSTVGHIHQTDSLHSDSHSSCDGSSSKADQIVS